MRYAQIVMGVKGCGKSTYCQILSRYAETKGRKMKIVNLDATAKSLIYEKPIADVRTVINYAEIEEAEKLAPGTGAGFEHVLTLVDLSDFFKSCSKLNEFYLKNVFVNRYLLDHPEWLFGAIGEIKDGDYIIFDCPGETDYHIHLKTMKVFAAMLVVKNFRTCGVFVKEGSLAIDGYSFIGSCLTSLTSYINLSIPHVNLMMKIDLLNEEDKSRLLLFINSDVKDVLRYENAKVRAITTAVSGSSSTTTPVDGYQELAKVCATAASILEGHNFVRKKYYPFDINDESSVKGFLSILDDIMGIPED